MIDLLFQPGDIEFLIIMIVFGIPFLAVFIGLPVLAFRIVEKLRKREKRKDSIMIDIVALYEPGDVVYVPCVVKKVKAVVESTSDFGLNKNKITTQYILQPNDKESMKLDVEFMVNGKTINDFAIPEKKATAAINFILKHEEEIKNNSYDAPWEKDTTRALRQNDKEINCNSCDHVDDNEGVYCYECSKDIQNNYTPKDSSK